MRNKLIIIALFALPSIALAEGKERDPFMPFGADKVNAAPSEAQKAVKGNTNASGPLTEDPLSAYTIKGIIVSPNDAVVLIKAHDKHEYFAGVGEPIGSEGGIIDVISSSGITVDINGKLVNLTINSRLDTENEVN